MTISLIILCAMLMCLIIGLYVTGGKIHADSPTVARQQIIDYPMDWYQINKTQGYFSDPATTEYVLANSLFNAENISDISSVTYSTDGKILNVTFWLTGPFHERPKRSAPEYYIRFDVDSNLLTGDRYGADYLFDVAWNNDTKSWIQISQEYSPQGKNFRVIQSNTNYTNFFSKLDSHILSERINKTEYLTCCYVSFPVDMKLMNSPAL